MKKVSIFVPLLLAILAGCGKSTEDISGSAAPMPTVSTQSNSNPAAPVTTPSAVQGKRELSTAEKIALEYVTVFINGADKASKEKFVHEKVHADTQPIFSLGVTSEPAETTYPNPRIIESTTYESNGQKSEIILVQADGNKEIIVLMHESKLGFVFTSNSQDTDFAKAFNEMRSKFKTAAPK